MLSCDAGAGALTTFWFVAGAGVAGWAAAGAAGAAGADVPLLLSLIVVPMCPGLHRGAPAPGALADRHWCLERMAVPACLDQRLGQTAALH